MKRVAVRWCVLSALLLTSISVFSQTVAFNNFSPNTNYRIRTNNLSGTASGLMANSGNIYQIGLYVRPSTNTGYELVAVTSNNGIAAGLFSGISPLMLPAPYTNGQRIHFQIRAWSSSAGSSYENALVAWVADPWSVQLGSSPPGITTLGSTGGPPGALFGTNEGQLSSGFVIGGCCPTFSLVHWVPHGLSTVAAPYFYVDVDPPPISQLVANAPEGTQIYKMERTGNVARWTVNQFQSGAWLSPNQRLNVGEAVFVRNPGAPFAITFEGTILAPNRPVWAGANLIGLPKGFDFTPNPGDFLMRWNGTTYATNYYTYVSGVGWRDQNLNVGAPSIPSTEGVFYFRNVTNAPALIPAPAVFFHNRIPAVPLDKPVTTTFGCVGTNLVAQLRASFDAGPFQDLGPSVPVLSSGYLNTGFNLLRELPTGAVAQVRVRVWDKRFASYDGAAGTLAVAGESPEFNVTIPPLFHPPANLTNFISTVGPLNPFYVDPPMTNLTVLAGDTAHFTFASLLQSQFGYSFQS